MYPLPDDFDPHVFAGRELEQVSFLPYSVKLVFDRGLSVQVFSEVVLEPPDGDICRFELSDVPIRSATLEGLVGLNIERAAVEPRATLVLDFENGHVLRIVEDRAPYECYHLRVGDREIIV